MAITGSTGGLGTALAAALAAKGARLALLDLDPELLERQVAALGPTVDAKAFVADVRDLAGLETAMAAAADHFGRLDVVTANAGVGTIAPLAILDPEAFERVIDIDLTGVWRTFRAALPHGQKQQGYLLAISSHPTFFQTPMMDAVHESAAGTRLWGGNKGGLWKMVSIDTVVRDIVAGIERLADQIVVPRSNTLVARMPGIFRPIVERLGFTGSTVPDAIASSSPSGLT